MSAKSKLVLGTAQLGSSYGIGNTTGQPSRDEAFKILDRAYDGGINTLDTATAYGNSEEVIGVWLSSRDRADVAIITKLKPNLLDEYPESPIMVIEKELHGSLSRLQLDAVDGYLLHGAKDMYKEGVMEGLRNIKAKGLVRNIGVSIYDEEDALHALDLGIDYIQIPYNALDQRLEQTDFFSRAKKAGLTVFARSPLLQGLLLMTPESIPAHLEHAKGHVARFQAIAQRYGLSPYEASLIFVHQQPHIEHIVFGVETLPQLEDIFRVAKMAEEGSPEDFLQEISQAFKNVDRAVVNPSLWNKKKI